MRRFVFSVFLLTVAIGGGWLLGQQQQPAQPTPVPQGLMTGSDIGIRVDTRARRDGKLYGTMMVRMQNGERREVILGRPGGVVPLDSRR
jgi:hypothetical protein